MNRHAIGRGLGMLAASALCALAHAGDLELSPLFGNHMVLQREQPVTIWGSAPNDSTVAVSIGDAHSVVEPDSAGAWTATLPPMDAGGPHTVSVSSGDETVTLKNVLIGDVWICSGQSNMFWRLEQTDRGAEFIESASEETEVRLFQMQKVWSRTPEDTVRSIGWRMSSPDTARRFSAVGYHFGRLLNEATGVPIGLIQSAWGGTPAEAWTPIETLNAAPDFYADRLASLETYDLDDATAEARIAEAQAKHATFVELAWREDIGEAEGWASPEHDDSAWPTLDLPGYVDGALGSFNGIVWLRRTIELGEVGRDAELLLGRLDDFDTAYVNGRRVGKTDVDRGDGRQIVRRYPVPDGLLREGRNTIAIALMDVRSSGGVRPEGRPFELRTASGSVDLTGAWRYKVGFDDRAYGGFPLPGNYAVPVGRVFRRPAALYNAMIHPLTRSGITGAIWYQGESNSGRGDEYRRLFPEMIEAWRDAWRTGRGNPSYGVPFYFVQLPNFRTAVDEPRESSWAELREAQRLTDSLPETGMAITIDLGDPSDIHPTNKLPVAERLARLALAEQYGVSTGLTTGPHPRSIRRDGARLSVTFDHAEGLHAEGGPARGFAVAGEDGVFHWAEAFVTGPSVVVSSSAVAKPVRVRYAWADNPRCNLYNGEGLPATPFEMTIE